jgi:hypothetical protein
VQYIALIFHSREADATDSKRMEAYGAFTQDIIAKGKFNAGNALQPSSTATCVRVDSEGKTVTMDGPFIESKEQLNGYYVLDCVDLDEAIEIASRIPDAQGGTIEVRPILNHE